MTSRLIIIGFIVVLISIFTSCTVDPVKHTALDIHLESIRRETNGLIPNNRKYHK